VINSNKENIPFTYPTKGDKMKKNMISMLVLIPCFIFFAAAPIPAMAETIDLTYSIFFPSTHGQCEVGTAWAKEIEKRTGGDVKITVFPGGTLTKANQTFDGVVNGISDIGMSCFAYTLGRFPVMESLDLPLGYPNGTVATNVVNDFYKKNDPQELKSVKVLYLHAHGPGLLHTKKPVKTLEDMKKMKIRSTGLSAKVVEALGGVPVAMAQGETYEALQKGVAEGTIGPIEVLKGWRQAEVIKHTTDCANVGYTTTMFVVMNLNKWNQLPENIKNIFTDVSREYIAIHGKTWDEVDKAGRDYTTSLGNDFISLDDNEKERWKKAVEPVIAEYVAGVDKKGLPGNQYIENINALIRQYGSK